MRRTLMLLWTWRGAVVQDENSQAARESALLMVFRIQSEERKFMVTRRTN